MQMLWMNRCGRASTLHPLGFKLVAGITIVFQQRSRKTNHLASSSQSMMPDSFDSATTDALRRDKTFMMQAVLQNGRVFSFALGDLRRDFDLAVLAVGGKNSVSFPRYRATNDDKAFFREVLAKSLEKVQAHENFTRGFLFGMSGNPGPDCSLSILATGVETSLALKKLIASFVGVPTGQDLWLHRQVTQNLAIEDLEIVHQTSLGTALVDVF